LLPVSLVRICLGEGPKLLKRLVGKGRTGTFDTAADFNQRPPPDSGLIVIFGSAPMFGEGAVLSRGPGPESSKAPHQTLSALRQQF
jgi:hypothetical protein